MISHKFEALESYRLYLNEIENQLEKKVKTLRTDHGREYLCKQFKKLCNDKGITRQLTIPSTPQQNGVAERRNITLLDMVRSMMAQENLPISYWGEALLTVVYILKSVPSKYGPTTPYELWNGRKSDLSFMWPWGCASYVHDPSNKYGKLGPRGKKSIFIRYLEFSKGCVFLGEQADGTVIEFKSRDATFMEDVFPSKGEVRKEDILYEIKDTELTNIRSVQRSFASNS